MKDLKPMTAEKARKLLENEYNWDVLKMAAELCISVRELSNTLQRGDASKAEHRLKAHYDVCFTPMVSVEIATGNPESPTEEEIDKIIEAAAEKLKSDIGDKISLENVEFIRTYDPDGDGSQNRKYICGNENTVDPEILFEMAVHTYPELYPGIIGEHSVTFAQIYELAKTLTEKYKNTDWSQEDFRDTMDTEAAAFIIKKHKDR